MVAAGCMVLYGYDAAVFNAVQKNDHWLAHFNKPVGNQDLLLAYILIIREARQSVGINQYILLYWCYCLWMVYWRANGKKIWSTYFVADID